MIELLHVCKRFANQGNAVNDLSLTINTGETLVLLGSSGCGKTTTLKMINRLLTPTSGKILLDKKDIKTYDVVRLRRSIGYAFQGVGLFPHMTIAENIAIVLRLNKVNKKQRLDRAIELLEFVQLDPKLYAHRYPEELSGGQLQRVGVARALVNKPKYLLMDEPFGALDAITRDNLQQDFLNLKQKLAITVVFVTHDVFEAMRIADRIAIMNKGDLLQVGTKEDIINNPVNDFVYELFAKPAMQANQYNEVIE